jgi:hypothetical protein
LLGDKGDGEGKESGEAKGAGHGEDDGIAGVGWIVY